VNEPSRSALVIEVFRGILFSFHSRSSRLALTLPKQLWQPRDIDGVPPGLVFRHRFRRSPSHGFHFTGVTVRGVPLLELIQPDAVSLHGLGSL
jgi:hypothetical protein